MLKEALVQRGYTSEANLIGNLNLDFKNLKDLESQVRKIMQKKKNKNFIIKVLNQTFLESDLNLFNYEEFKLRKLEDES